MSVRVLAVRPRLVPIPSFPALGSSRPSAVLFVSSSSGTSPVRVGWDELRGLDVAVCFSCAESFASSHVAGVDDWADGHRCDAELAALLALVTSRRAA
ncbi:hypothetical protein [Actinomadura chibensis]|uniref:Uncharacterized protein n=1 Tax=Actinomadura chibensis TaxID=392828 RepID=A0A5D0NYU3_9ACTN|nr:hypothetical protein [Actinomadura chibensis]TYB49328.1 hypothetical protein FXF69_09595 [Actinomadura chibensis]